MYQLIEITFTKPYMKNYGEYTKLIYSSDLASVKARMQRKGFKITKVERVGEVKGGKQQGFEHVEKCDQNVSCKRH